MYLMKLMEGINRRMVKVNSSKNKKTHSNQVIGEKHDYIIEALGSF